MKIDLYTKGILTVIALSLVVIAFNKTPLVKEALARVNMQVEICETEYNCASVNQFEKALEVYCVNCNE